MVKDLLQVKDISCIQREELYLMHLDKVFSSAWSLSIDFLISELSSLLSIFLLTLYLLSIPLWSCGSFHVTAIASLTSLAVTSLGWLGTKTNGMIQRADDEFTTWYNYKGRSQPQNGMSDPDGKLMRACLHDYSSKLYFDWYHCYSIFFKNSVVT